uniref:Ion transport domain-containing protein n=1 Tax=Zooxanthella nutricula TaxID=1333877 RepID=A0A7S2L518_9DINO
MVAADHLRMVCNLHPHQGDRMRLQQLQQDFSSIARTCILELEDDMEEARSYLQVLENALTQWSSLCGGDCLDIAVEMHDVEFLSLPPVVNLIGDIFHRNFVYSLYSRPDDEATYSFEELDNFYRFSWAFAKTPWLRPYRAALFQLAGLLCRRSLRETPHQGQGRSPSRAVGPYAVLWHHYLLNVFCECVLILLVQCTSAMYYTPGSNLLWSEMVMITWFLGKIVEEFREVHRVGVLSYATDFWNCIDMLLLTVLCGACASRCSEHYMSHPVIVNDVHVYKVMMAFATLFLWTRTLPVLMLNESLGPVVTTVLAMLKTLSRFAAILGVVFCGFIFAMHPLLSPSDDPVLQDYQSLHGTIQKIFLATYGNFEVDFGLGPYARLGELFICAFEVFTGLLLMNLLIALLSADVIGSDVARQEFHFTRAKSVLELRRKVQHGELPTPLNLLTLLFPDKYETCHLAFLVTLPPLAWALLLLLAVLPVFTAPTLIIAPHGPVRLLGFWLANVAQCFLKLMAGFCHVRRRRSGGPKFQRGDIVISRLGPPSLRLLGVFGQAVKARVTRVDTNPWLHFLALDTYDIEMVGENGFLPPPAEFRDCPDFTSEATCIETGLLSSYLQSADAHGEQQQQQLDEVRERCEHFQASVADLFSRVRSRALDQVFR